MLRKFTQMKKKRTRTRTALSPMPLQDLEKAKTSEYEYFKKLKHSNCKNMTFSPTLQVQDITPLERPQKIQPANYYRTVFRKKRQHLHDLADNTFKEQLQMTGSQCLLMIFQRLELLCDNAGCMPLKRNRKVSVNCIPEFFSPRSVSDGHQNVDTSSNSNKKDFECTASQNVTTTTKQRVLPATRHYFDSPLENDTYFQPDSHSWSIGIDNVTEDLLCKGSLCDSQQLTLEWHPNPITISDKKLLFDQHQLAFDPTCLEFEHEWMSDDSSLLPEIPTKREFVIEPSNNKSNKWHLASPFIPETIFSAKERGSSYRRLKQGDEFHQERDVLSPISPILQFHFLAEGIDENSHCIRGLILGSSFALEDLPLKDAQSSLKLIGNEDFLQQDTNQECIALHMPNHVDEFYEADNNDWHQSYRDISTDDLRESLFQRDQPLTLKWHSSDTSILQNELQEGTSSLCFNQSPIENESMPEEISFSSCIKSSCRNAVEPMTNNYVKGCRSLLCKATDFKHEFLCSTEVPVPDYKIRSYNKDSNLSTDSLSPVRSLDYAIVTKSRKKKNYYNGLMPDSSVASITDILNSSNIDKTNSWLQDKFTSSVWENEYESSLSWDPDISHGKASRLSLRDLLSVDVQKDFPFLNAREKRSILQLQEKEILGPFNIPNSFQEEKYHMQHFNEDYTLN